MNEPADAANECVVLVEQAREHDRAGRAGEALAAAWQAHALAPDDLPAKRTLAKLLRRNPELAVPEWRAGLTALLDDADIEPDIPARAGWHMLLGERQPLATGNEPAALARWAEADPFVLRLLAECPVSVLAAERPLTRLRRWLLLSRAWHDHPRLVAALAAQAAWNGGAWLIEADERAALDALDPETIAAAYFPRRTEAHPEPALADAVTAAVAGQYEEWPYPTWSRILRPMPRTLPQAVAAIDGGRPSPLPVAADVLVAGCGTGREAALRALTYPDARITAIDISEASLAYARARCGALGLDRIAFHRLELQRVAELGKTFDCITCCGVLHHLPDPEAGWAALTAVLRPGGVMQVMVYSKVARLRIRAAQRHLEDLRGLPVDDDLLREARRRLIERAPALLAASADFYTLSGIHDLLLHRHEDPFDVPRIRAALDRLGLELLAFKLPTPWHRARYREDNPGDPAYRDIDAWAKLERREPFLFAGMYDFTCRKPG